jgi:antitoxin (DNA-binding transcriptional repressor) of toxin-antitoxin stability system
LYGDVQRRTIVVMTAMTVSEARAHLPQLLDRVTAGDEVSITRHGKQVAVVIRPDRLRVRRATGALGTADKVRELIERGRATGLSDAPTISSERVAELVADVRDGREGRDGSRQR